jgi:hypothetical protein
MAAGRSAKQQQVLALQAALAAEQAAIYGYGVVGAHLTGTALAGATTDYTAHEAAANRLTSLLQASGAAPAPSAVAYQLPHRVATAGEAAALAATLEDQVASAYLHLVGLSGGAVRLLAAGQLRAAALRAAAWRGATVAFPGQPAAAGRG